MPSVIDVLEDHARRLNAGINCYKAEIATAEAKIAHLKQSMAQNQDGLIELDKAIRKLEQEDRPLYNEVIPQVRQN